jgi:glucokinase
MMAAEQDYVIGLDVGGTRIKSGAVSRKGRLLVTGVLPTGAERGPQALLRLLTTEVHRLERKMRRPAVVVGIGMPGAVERERGVMLLPSGRLQGMEGFPLVPRLARALKRSVIADNDGRLSMLAERTYGGARRHDWAVTVTLGTGVGSGVLLDGRILRDPHLQFGTQLSHIVMQAAGGRLCLTGAEGTAETLCSATALATAVRDGLARGIPSRLSARYHKDPRSVDFEAVMEGVTRKDSLCMHELDQWMENLGWFLVSVVNAFAPEIVILSGGATNAGRFFLRRLQAHVDRHIFRYPRGDRVPIVVSRMGDRAGVLGAAALAWERAS